MQIDVFGTVVQKDVFIEFRELLVRNLDQYRRFGSSRIGPGRWTGKGRTGPHKKQQQYKQNPKHGDRPFPYQTMRSSPFFHTKNINQTLPYGIPMDHPGPAVLIRNS